jgi:cytochrome c-type biogenesis protein CcmH
MRHLLLSLALAALLTAPAAAQNATLPDIEDEVMCVVCGTALNVSNSASAEQQRDFIRRRIDEGKSKQEILDALVEEYGAAVLATPEDEGFDLIPVAIALFALVAIGLGVRRWRRTAGNGQEPAAPAGPDLDPDDARRLDAELAAFDRS